MPLTGYEWCLSVKFAADQPRVPAGDSRGGQWAGSGGGSTTVDPVGGLDKAQAEVESRLQQMEENRNASIDTYKNMASDQLLSVHGIVDRKVTLLGDWKKKNPDTWTNTQENDLNGWKTRRDRIRAEERFRKDWYDGQRKLAAIKESRITGKVVLERGDVEFLLANPGDVYKDAKIKPDGGRYPYTPELFKRSDLSGAMIRHYIALPDGRIAHPDEIHEARDRGRLLVVDLLKVPPRDWTRS